MVRKRRFSRQEDVDRKRAVGRSLLVWTGKEMLPELFRTENKETKIFLWKICEGKSFLELDLGETPFKKDRFYSIDPYSFLDTRNYN